MKYFYRRNLPHYQPPGGRFFVTFRLVNSLPKSVVTRLKKEYNSLMKDAENKNRTKKRKLLKVYFQKFDQFLDRSNAGNLWLRRDSVAQIVADRIHDFDSEKYTLICFCIMPNHVHLLVELFTQDEKDKNEVAKFLPLAETMKLIKGSTAYECNTVLSRKGQFWQHESYDHLVRDNDELERVIRYILLNPVKAGLVNKWQDWKWTYCREKYVVL
ncbi:MAG TPA: transposase [Balneolaceae bacterium]|nr:transposase [Balneolaceae bacterium]